MPTDFEEISLRGLPHAQSVYRGNKYIGYLHEVGKHIEAHIADTHPIRCKFFNTRIEAILWIEERHV